MEKLPLGERIAIWTRIDFSYGFDPEWDDILNTALDKYSPSFDRFICKCGPLYVWVQNFPYAYGGMGLGGVFERSRPSRKTLERLRLLQLADLNEKKARKDENRASKIEDLRKSVNGTEAA